MSIDDVLKALSHRGLQRNLGKKTLSVEETKQALLEIIIGERPPKKICQEKPAFHSSACDCNNFDGFNQGCDEYEQKLREMFK